MLTHANEVDAELVCQNRLVDDVPYDAWLRQQGPIVGEGHVAKGVEPDLELHHRSQPTEPSADSPAGFQRPRPRMYWIASQRHNAAAQTARPNVRPELSRTSRGGVAPKGLKVRARPNAPRSTTALS